MLSGQARYRFWVLLVVVIIGMAVAAVNQPHVTAQGTDPLYPCGTHMRRVSVSASGQQTISDHGEQYVSLSADGRFVVFDSGAPLVAGDTNNEYDVFVLDCAANMLTRANVSSSGEQSAPSLTAGKDITPDGRYVVFYSAAPNLVADDTNGRFDIFVRDLQMGITRRVSISPSGEQTNFDAYPSAQSISADGSLVTFQASSNAMGDIYVHHLQTGITESVLTNAGIQPDGSSGGSLISADGRFIAFSSSATTLVPNDTNGVEDAFVIDLSTDQIQINAINSAGERANMNSRNLAISADGSITEIFSSASNLAPNDINSASDVFIHNSSTQTTVMVSVNSSGQQANYYISGGPMSADGRYVVFATGATNFVADDNNGFTDVFVHDVITHKTVAVSVNSLGQTAHGNSWSPTLSDNGRYIAFVSDASDLVVGDTNNGFDSFIVPNPLFSTTVTTATASPSVTATATSTLTSTPSVTHAFTPTATATVSAVHPDTIGIFRPAQTSFYLRNSNTTGYADSVLTFGSSIYYPITGDWNGDGIDTPGMYQSSIGQFYLTNSTANPAALHYTFTLGIAGDQPIVGDWDGDGKDGVGVFRPSNGLIYLKNNLTTGFADFTMVLGIPGDVGLAGDWNGDGKDSPGVYRPSNQIFYLTNSTCNCAVFADAQLGLGIAGDKPFVGDWDGDGRSGVGVYRQSNGLTYIKNVLTTGFADSSFVYGSANDFPLAGYWVRVSTPSAVEPAPTFQPSR